MPTILTHAFIGHMAGKMLLLNEKKPVVFQVSVVILPVLPDLDALFLPWIPYAHPLGHRGFCHSLCCALFLALVTFVLIGKLRKPLPVRRSNLFLFLFLLSASHGLLDMATDGGLGIALFSPFSQKRFFFPWQPIPVAPLSAKALFTFWGLKFLVQEILLIWPIMIIAYLIQKYVVRLVNG